jgi:hypothetical protein
VGIIYGLNWGGRGGIIMFVASVQYSLPGILMRLDVPMERDDIGPKKNM